MRYTKKALWAMVNSLNEQFFSDSESFVKDQPVFILYTAYGSYALRTQSAGGGQATVTELMTSRELGRYLDGMLKFADLKRFQGHPSALV